MIYIYNFINNFISNKKIKYIKSNIIIPKYKLYNITIYKDIDNIILNFIILNDDEIISLIIDLYFTSINNLIPFKKFIIFINKIITNIHKYNNYVKIILDIIIKEIKDAFYLINNNIAFTNIQNNLLNNYNKLDKNNNIKQLNSLFDNEYFNNSDIINMNIFKNIMLNNDLIRINKIPYIFNKYKYLYIIILKSFAYTNNNKIIDKLYNIFTDNKDIIKFMIENNNYFLYKIIYQFIYNYDDFLKFIPNNSYHRFIINNIIINTNNIVLLNKFIKKLSIIKYNDINFIKKLLLFKLKKSINIIKLSTNII